MWTYPGLMMHPTDEAHCLVKMKVELSADDAIVLCGQFTGKDGDYDADAHASRLCTAGTTEPLGVVRLAAGCPDDSDERWARLWGVDSSDTAAGLSPDSDNGSQLASSRNILDIGQNFRRHTI